MYRSSIILLLASAILVAGCSADDPLNPSFPLTVADARAAMQEMRDAPRPLQRPVVVLGGFHDPGILSTQLAGRLRRLTGDDHITSLAFGFQRSFDSCRERLIAHVEREYPCEDALGTTEVDIVAISMGGLVARYAAADSDNGQKSLRIGRLFTISTPHLGANLAPLPTLDGCQIAMRRGSSFLETLNATMDDEPYEIVPYVRLGDWIVGAENTAPPGMQAWWVANKPLEMAHVMACGDERILADIARRLRGEEPFATTPPASLPETNQTSTPPEPD